MQTLKPIHISASPIKIENCNLAKAIKALGDEWIMLIIRAALYGVSRFDDFQNELKIPRNILAQRLKKLVSANLLEKRDYKPEKSRTRSEYVLTQKGRDLLLAFIALTQWGDKWLGDGKVPIFIKSKQSGNELKIALTDNGNAIPAQDWQIVVRSY